ncbi:alpha/beta hydrolase [Bradyrhizobium sp. sGM-13]|uniref:alpha/beta hydrolase n=1 Tax=Bradyrhizobium sp. sGM-13 TaxID=2831781 RepID=UPI001BCCBD9B|nr:alpha/beta hydrolase [Bradyrhizobium sp. sGM-13]
MLFNDVLAELISFLKARFPGVTINAQTYVHDLISPSRILALVHDINSAQWVKAGGMSLRPEEARELRLVNDIALRLFHSLPKEERHVAKPVTKPTPSAYDRQSDQQSSQTSQQEDGSGSSSFRHRSDEPQKRFQERMKDDVAKRIERQIEEQQRAAAEEAARLEASRREAQAQHDRLEERRSEIGSERDFSELERRMAEQLRAIERDRQLRELEAAFRADLSPSVEVPVGSESALEDALSELARADEGQTHPTVKSVTRSLWYGTNRKPVQASDINKGFSGERDSRVHLGLCKVHIPESHKIGSVGSSWWKRLFTGVDDRLKTKSLEEYSADRFWDAISAQLAKLPVDDREAVVFVHGYNVSFADAAVRAAQLAADLAIRGSMAFFSWPSKGSTESYIHDEASIEASESAITEFLVGFAERSGAARLHIIAHSMGNRGVLRAVNRIAAAAAEHTGKPFDQIILAAPDVDADVFRDLCKAYSRVSRRTTLYVSSKDWAVEAARWLHGFPRAGLLPPVMVAPGIDTVNVTHADLTMLGHGYVAEARLVLTDMHALLRFGAHPRDRAGLQLQSSDDGQAYWLIGR